MGQIRMAGKRRPNPQLEILTVLGPEGDREHRRPLPLHPLPQSRESQAGTLQSIGCLYKNIHSS